MGGGRTIFGKRIKKQIIKEQKTIGVVGVSRGTGTTFCTMMMAYYIKQVIKAKTAVVERNVSGSLLSLPSFYEEETIASIKGIDILGQQKEEKEISAYSYLLFDYGTRVKQMQETIFPNFFDCKIKLVTASLCFWRQEELFHFVETWSKIQGNEEWIYLIPFASSSAVKKMEKQLCRKMYTVVLEQEWYRMGTANLALWNKILKE